MLRDKTVHDFIEIVDSNEPVPGVDLFLPWLAL